MTTDTTASDAATSTSRYGFHGRLSAAFPSQVVVDITEVCNLACIHCPHPEFKKSHEYGARYLDPALNTKLVEEVREAGRGHTLYLRYTSNGEPLVHPKAYDMIEEAVRRSGAFVTITTNGTIMNEKRTRKLLEAGVHLIDISIDAFNPETYAKIRVGGDLETVRENVIRLLSWVRDSDGATKVVVSFVEQPQNSNEAALFERYWREAGAHQVVIRRLHSAAGAVQPVALLMKQRISESGRYPCLYPWERITLNPRGDLEFCPQDWVHGSVLGHYSTVSIKDVWQSEFYKRLREAHLANDFAKHPFCGQCPDWRGTRWPGQGRSYADMVEDLLA